MMPRLKKSHREWLVALVLSALSGPSGASRIATAVLAGVICHALFQTAVFAMISAMSCGMSASIGRVPWPWAGAVDAALLLQFPLVHSTLLGPARQFLNRIGSYGSTLATTTYAIIASLQLASLFIFWSPTGIVWWRADGIAGEKVSFSATLCMP